jgi:hypothetical protein
MEVKCLTLAEAKSIESNSKIKFAGHETFAFRYGWLKKAVDCLDEDQDIFSKDEAIVVLGVGKNMVKSIKHWALATQIFEEDNEGLRVSPLGESLFQKWDPFFEDPASLWLIHWLLVTNLSKAALWYLVFNKYPRPDFTKNQILEFTLDLTSKYNIKVIKTTVGRDIDCFIRTYIPAKGSKIHLEESFNCPLNEVSIISQLRDGESYQFNVGPKYTLPVHIVGYALINYITSAQRNRKTISVSDCLYSESSPGQVFKLDENTLVEYIEELYKLTNGAIELDETAGLKQIYSKREYAPEELLDTYYS